MRLSVVIPAYNNLDKVLRCLNSLQAHQVMTGLYYPTQQYVVQDDASPDYNLKALIPPCAATVMRNEQNAGFNQNVAKAVYNSGVAAVHPGNPDVSEFVAIVNQDIYAVPDLSQNWDTVIMHAFDDPQVGIVGPKLLFPQGGIQSCGGEFDGRGQPSHRYLGYSDIHYPPADTPEYVDWITGAFFVVRRSVWDALGGFDPLFAPAYWEDVDFCLRAREIGFKTWYEPRATFIHEVGSSGSSGLASGAQKFYERWVASGKIKPTTPAVKERFW